MNTKTIILSVLVAVFGITGVGVTAQQDEDVRGAFMTTRPQVTSGVSGSRSTPRAQPSHRRPKTTPATASTNVTSSNTSKGHTGNSGSGGTKLNPVRMGLGVTLFMRDSTGLAVRTDPSHTFQKGDHVRFLIETNADGYLYVFNTTDDGKPVMLYPDPQLDDGGNYFQAHVPFEIPSSVAPEERLRWLTFDEHPGAEKLYFVFSREPLAGVPIEDDLISHCQANKCPWNPGDDVWTEIQKQMKEPMKIARTTNSGAQTSAEHRAATRGIGLNRDDPEPSLIMLSASTTSNVLVAQVDLIHKAAFLSGVSNNSGR